MLNQKLLGSVSSTAITSDDNFENVSLLLSGNGTNGAQNNTFIDSSTNNFTITRYGNTTQGSFSPYGSNWSNQTTAASSWFTLGNPSQLNPGSGNFTIEGWFNGIEYGSAGYTPLYAKYQSGGLNDFFIGAYSNGSIEFSVQDTSNAYYSITAPSGTASLGVWYHFALVRNGATLTAYLNGTSLGTSNIGTATVRNSANIAIGKLDGYGSNVNGGAYFSNYRYVNSAVYTSAFTPSTVPLTAISGTQLLTFQSNKFIDNSPNNLNLTLNGTPSVQRFSPFNPTAPYSTSVIGGSGYFDGSGDVLTAPTSTEFTFGTGDFTIECWYYLTSSPSNMYIFDMSGNGTRIQIDSSNLYLIPASGNYLQTSAVGRTINTWHHVAMVRQSGTLYGYVNGVSFGNTSNSSLLADTKLDIAQYGGGGGNNFIGYITNFRVVKSAVYPSGTTFTPPTSPITAISNTVFLANMSNAGIPDLAMQNNLETVGDVQVSTSVKKYGTGSLAFDGSGDYLAQPNKPQYLFNTGDFTVELWYYPTSLSGTPSAYQGIVGMWGQTTGSISWLLYLSAGNLIWYTSTNGSSASATMSGTSGMSINNWYHLALVRYNGTTTIYVNGSSITSTSSSVNLFNATCGLSVGYNPAGGTPDYVYGYIDDLRITNGLARYTANFTPPIAALPTF